MPRGAVALLAALLVAVSSGVALATTSRVTSEPNGDLGLLVSVGCGGTDRDKDGDFNTCTNGDTASMLASVDNRTDTAQTIRLEWAFDGPGTEFDSTFVEEALVGPGELFDVFDELRVKKATPLGGYILTVTASGSETASTSATFTVHSKNGK